MRLSKGIFTGVIFLIALCAAAIPAGAWENMVPNPAFEQADPHDASQPFGWEYRQNFVSPASRGDARGIWDTRGFKGARSLSIAEERWHSASQWSCTVENIKPGTWYLLSLRAKRDRDTGWLPKARVFDQSRLVYVKKAGSYRYFEFLLHSGTTDGQSELALIVYKKPYTAWFDDLRLVELSIKQLSYLDGRTLDSQLPYFAWSMPENGQAFNYSVELYKDGSETPLYVWRGIEDLFFRGPILPAGDYRWRVGAYSGSVLLSMSEFQSFKSIPKHRAADMGPHGYGEFFAGTPFAPGVRKLREAAEFPIGISGLSAEIAAEAAESGFNWIFLPSDPAAYMEEGMKIISSSSACPHASILYLYDEPEQSGILPKAIRDRHIRAGKDLPEIPTAITVYDPDRYMEYAGTSDILMVDPYPVPVRPLSSVPEAVLSARAVRGGKPVWAIIQAFDWTDCSPEAERTGLGRMPTYEEIKAMAYMAIAAGAEGIIFYALRKYLQNRPELLETLKKISRELRSQNNFLTADGGEYTFAPPFYLLEKTVQGEGRYLLAVNSRPEPALLGEETVGPYGVIFRKTDADAQKTGQKSFDGQ